MDIGICGAITDSPNGEDFARPYKTNQFEKCTVSSLRDHLDSEDSDVLKQMHEVFAIPDNNIGILALLEETKTDIAALGKIFVVPEWSSNLEKLRITVLASCSSDPVRDLASLRSQPKSPVRDFLAPLDKKLSSDQQKAVRSIRGLITLKLLSGREQITSTLADEIRRWLVGKGPDGLALQDINTKKLLEIRKTFSVEGATAKLLTFLITALEANLKDPFETVNRPSSIVSCDPVDYLDDEFETVQITASDLKDPMDPLRGFLAESGIAGVRIFSGVLLYHGMLPVELELTIPKLIDLWRSENQDEVAASLLTLFTRVHPSGFPEVPLTVEEGAGLWVDVELGRVCWNLDEAISSHSKDNPFQLSSNDRYVSIPLPLEVAEDLRRRREIAGNPKSLAELFPQDLEGLARSTKSMLRELALSSHRPTLSRLSRSWARYVLSVCNDEAYASAIGIDFTVGTSANFNYLLILGSRVGEILRTAYRKIGFSGELDGGEIKDIGSLWIPEETQVAALVQTAMSEVSQLVRCLPRRISKETLKETHNIISVHIYSILKFMLGGRELTEETITKSRIDLCSGLVLNTDKRTAPYNERRIACLAPTLLRWLETYLAWLKLVAYRLRGEDRTRSFAIASIFDRNLDGDKHPLFFRFSDGGRVVALGSEDLSRAYVKFGIKNNGGRHFLDFLFRNSGLDSADIMGWMGRANPGQETFGSWSAAVPLESASSCAEVIERWLQKLTLPQPPDLNPRPLTKNRQQKVSSLYLPRLLQSNPGWTSCNNLGPVEPCPFDDDTIKLSSIFLVLFQAWRNNAPPDGWLGLGLSLVFEDGVMHPQELNGTLQEFKKGTVYWHDRLYFVDCKPEVLGIRRVWLSEVTDRLLFQMQASPNGLVSVDSLNDEANQYLEKIIPEAQGKGLHFIISCAAAFRSLRMPGLLFGWVRGFRFARTSRPEMVARHLLGVTEIPKFDTRHRKRRQRSLNEVLRALSRAGRKVQNGWSHGRALAGLKNYLNSIYLEFDQTSLEALAIGYLMHLCTVQKNISTVVRYQIGARRFLEKAAEAIEKSGFNQVDWKSLVSICLVEGGSVPMESPERTAINHALEWLGIDARVYQRTGPPPSALQYAEIPSDREGEIAITHLRERQVTVGDDWHRAATALKLLFAHPHRWDGVASLRLCDLALDVKHPHLVITWEAGGNLKSGNAPRVLQLDDDGLIENLKVICAQRTARFPDDRLAPVFGDDDDPRSNVASHRIHHLVGEALYHATGSPVIRPHDTRDAVITRGIQSLLDVDARERNGQTLRLRQGMFQITAQAGQSAPDIPMGNYGHDFDVHRRRWITKINDGMNCPYSPAFLSKVTGIPAATYRKRISRHGEISHDIFENFDDAPALHTGARTINLSSLVSIGIDRLPWDPACNSDKASTDTAIYVGLRLLGETETEARMASRLSGKTSSRLESGLVGINRRRSVALRARVDINRNAFMDAVIESGLTIAMHAMSPPQVVINRFVTSIPMVGDTLDLANPEDILDFKPWIDVWKANGIETEVVLKNSRSSAVDGHLMDRLRAVGVMTARSIADRHFKRGIRGHLKFIPTQQSKHQSKPRASPQLSFLVSACAISLFLLNQGETL